ncbi:hypothetical protein DYB36_001605 [Aphanomyces astaci]|uniref:Protein kinase domain-containing protein n=1 Tax=Aphanomyces astaci TaxID=112090 RepID=A0A397AYS6_APHAT|nr:hypothetical protein DYB36_001605 [Aphanomyces astaci]
MTMTRPTSAAPRSSTVMSSATPPLFRLTCYILLSLLLCFFLVLHVVGSVLVLLAAIVLRVRARATTTDFPDRSKSLVSTYRKTWLALYKADAYILCWYRPRLADELHVPRDESEVADDLWAHFAYFYLWRGVVGTCIAAVPTVFWTTAVSFLVAFFNASPAEDIVADTLPSQPLPWTLLLDGCAYIALGIVVANALIPWCLEWCVHANMLLFPAVNYNLHFEEGAPLIEPPSSSWTQRATQLALSAAKRRPGAVMEKTFDDAVKSLVTSKGAAAELKRVHHRTLAKQHTHQTLLLVRRLLEHFVTTVPSGGAGVSHWVDSTVAPLRKSIAGYDDDQGRLANQLERVEALLRQLTDGSLAKSDRRPRQDAQRTTASGDGKSSVNERSDLEGYDDDDVLQDMTPRRQKRPTQLAQLGAEESPEYHVFSPTSATDAATYGMLSPPNRADTGIFRSIFSTELVDTSSSSSTTTSRDDAVHFQAYAPPVVAAPSTFEFAVWAFLVHQRDEVRELAVSSSALSREVLLPVRRGALAHVTLEVPRGFAILDEPTKAMDWQGDVTTVQFQLQCTSSSSNDGQAMIQATIVVGAKVMKLKAYLFVSGKPTHAQSDDDVAALSCELERLEESFHEIAFDDLDVHDGQVVGAGHYGDAVRATYRGAEVVVKSLRPDAFGSNSDQIVREFRHEAAVLNMFGHHPNIVPFVGASTDLSKPLTLVTSYLPYGSVADSFIVSSNVKLSLSQKEIVLYDAAAGLLNVHEGGFVHRDIAARNVLIDPVGRGKLCDFGLCRRVDASIGGSHFQHGHLPLRYMAPESLQPPHAFSFKSDAYMFGVLMWETLTEAKPFGALAPQDAAALVLEGHRLAYNNKDGSNTIIPPKYQHLMEGCFAEDPAKRLSMVELVHALGRLNVV